VERGGGLVGEEKESWGFLAKPPPPSSPTGQGQGKPTGRPAWGLAGGPGHGGVRGMGQNGGGDEEVLLPFLPWAGVC
jgi:hypothetical protein